MIFKPAENLMAYAKVGLLGFAGSGKTRTAWEIVKGLYSAINCKTPIAMLDTETGSDFILPLAKQAGIDLVVSKTRAFKDLISGIQEAEKISKILIIDSVSHFWLDLVESYKRKKNTNRLAFQDWGILKPMWNEFSTWYVTCALHVIVCGRAGFEYDYFQDEDGKMELHKTGTKMKAEGEFGFEPSLLIEMERIKNPQATDEYRQAKSREAKARAAEKIRGERQWVRRAWVLKDRADVLDGEFFDNPTFENFRPHWAFLNIGGKHQPIEQGDSQGMFDHNGKPEWKKEREQCQIVLEEIENEMIKAGLAGNASEAKRNKITMLEFLFQTSSWSKISTLNLETLRVGLNNLRAAVSTPSFMESILTGEESKPQEKIQEPDEDDKLIAEFKDLKTPGLMAWERENRDKLASYSVRVQSAFIQKWRKVTGKEWPDGGIRTVQDQKPESEPTEPPEDEKVSSEGKPEGKTDDMGEMVKCPKSPDPESPDEYSRVYCENKNCFPCPGWPEWKEE